MNFQFDLDAIFPEDLMLIGRDLTPQLVDRSLNASTPSEYYRRNFCKLDPSSRLCLGEVLDQMGAASARAQGLQQVISTMEKLRTSENHIIYIITHKATDREVGGADICVGFLKVGRKRLFILDSSSCQNEVLPVSVLDFYVHESLQRHGYGKQLFDAMLQNEDVLPAHLAIDRPSHKLTSFLAKHYGLLEPCPQVNNYVVYPGFFADRDDDLLFRRHCAAPDQRKVAAPCRVALEPVPGGRPGGGRGRRRPWSLVPTAGRHPPAHREPGIGAAHGGGLPPPAERSASALDTSQQKEREGSPGCQRPCWLRCSASEQQSSPVRPGSSSDRPVETPPLPRTSASSLSLRCAPVAGQGSSGQNVVSFDARPPEAVDTSVGAPVYSAAGVLPLPQTDSSRLHAAMVRHSSEARRASARRPVQNTPFATLPSGTDLMPPSQPASDTIPAECDRGSALQAADATPSCSKPGGSSPAGDVTCVPTSSPSPAAVSQPVPDHQPVSSPAPRHQPAPDHQPVSSPGPRHQSAPDHQSVSSPAPRHQPVSSAAPRHQSPPNHQPVSSPAPRHQSAPDHQPVSSPAPRHQSPPDHQSVSSPAPRHQPVSSPAPRHQSPWQRGPSPLRFCRTWSPRRPACCPPSSTQAPVFSANYPWMVSKDELFYPNKRTSPGKGSDKVISMLDKNGSANGPPAYSRHAHNGSHLSASPGSSPCQGRRELRNLHDHHQLW